MKMYKFKDRIDGNYAFIIARNEHEAEIELNRHTSLQFDFVESKELKDLKNPIVVINNILPF
jgi:hypothetical protein